MDRKLISNLLGISEKSYYRWKENRTIFKLLEIYFTDKDIQEFLETGEIKKFENMKFITDNYIAKSQAFYLNSFIESQSLSQPSMHNEFRDFYFNFLANFGKINFPFNINILGIQSLLTHYLYQYQTQKIKENLKIDEINEEVEDIKLELDKAIISSIGQERKELEKFKENFQEEIQKEEIIEDIFSDNERHLEGIMLHFFTFNSWNNDMYYFLELVKKDEFEYFIMAKNDELLYQAIGYLVYSYYQNLNMRDKIALINSSYHYFLGNKSLISKDNIKIHISERVNNPKVFKEIDEKLSEKYCNKPYPVDNNDFDLTNFPIINEGEIEEITIEELLNKNKL